MRTALIDGDEIAYKISSRYESKYQGVYKDDRLLWRCRTKEEAYESVGNRDDLEISEIIELRDIKGFEQRIKESVDSIVSNTNCDNFLFCLSGSENFRYPLATLLPYKANRDGKDKPGYYPKIKSYIRENLPSVIEDHLEADDLLAYHGYYQYHKVICSSDKDLKTVESNNYSIKTGKFQRIDKDTALYNFYYQLLIGDSIDNIPSPMGLGAVGAKKILQEVIGSTDEAEYLNQILEPYAFWLNRKDKEGNFRTKWYSYQPVEEVLWEVGNLLYMHRTLDVNERWELPDISHLIKKEING